MFEPNRGAAEHSLAELSFRPRCEDVPEMWSLFSLSPPVLSEPVHIEAVLVEGVLVERVPAEPLAYPHFG